MIGCPLRMAKLLSLMPLVAYASPSCARSCTIVYPMFERRLRTTLWLWTLVIYNTGVLAIDNNSLAHQQKERSSSSSSMWMEPLLRRSDTMMSRAFDWTKKEKCPPIDLSDSPEIIDRLMRLLRYCERTKCLNELGFGRMDVTTNISWREFINSPLLGSWVIEAFVKRGASLRGLSDFRFRRLFVASPNVLEIEMDFLNPSVEARVKFGVWKNAYVGWVKVLCYFFSTFFRGLCVPTDQFSVLAQTIGYLHQAKVIVQLQVDALQCRPEETPSSFSTLRQAKFFYRIGQALERNEPILDILLGHVHSMVVLDVQILPTASEVKFELHHAKSRWFTLWERKLPLVLDSYLSTTVTRLLQTEEVRREVLKEVQNSARDFVNGYIETEFRPKFCQP